MAVREVEEGRTARFDLPLETPVHSSRWLANLELLWEHRRRLLKVTAWAFAVSIVVALIAPKTYESTVSIMPPDALGTNSMMMATLASKGSPELAAMAAGMLGMKTTGSLFVGLVRSHTVEDHVVDRIGLQQVYHSKYRQDAWKSLERRTEVKEDRKTGIITLTVSDQDAQRARNIAQAYVEELNHLVSQVSTSSARRERVFIEQRLTTVKADLEDAEKEFSAFASKNATLDIKEQTRAMVESAAMLQGELIAAQSELEGLMQIYNPNNVRVRSAQARVAELRRQLAKIGGTDASLSSPDNPESGELYPSIRKLPLLGVQWADLYRRVKIQETVYELLNQQYELARIQEAKEVPTVDVIDPANLPERRSWPPRTLLVLVLTTMSFLGAIALTILVDRINKLDPEDPRSILTRRLSTFTTRGLNRGLKLVRPRQR